MSLSKCIVKICFDNGDEGYFVRWEGDGFRWSESDELATEVSYHAFFDIKEKLLEFEGVSYVFDERLYD